MTCSDPDDETMPPHAPLATHVPFPLQVRVAVAPTLTVEGEIEIAALAGGTTDSVALVVAVPPTPVQVMLYVACPVAVGLTDKLPLIGCAPLHAPLAVHPLALLASQFNVDTLPSALTGALKVREMAAGGTAVGSNR
jgi:hypothetical protein